ncbi:MAG: DUF1294 domain-containing protein [Candidatus Methanomethylophilaceae archaeon]
MGMDPYILTALVFLILNLIVFIVYAVDKWKAQNKRWRIPESVLIGLGAVCPWGALGGMYYFRHKTKKPKFKLIWVFALAHAVAAIALVLLL